MSLKTKARPSMSKKKERKLNPELYNHMTEKEKKEYKKFLNDYDYYIKSFMMRLLPGRKATIEQAKKEIDELEKIAEYRIKQKKPKTKLEDWEKKRQPDFKFKKEVEIKKNIKLNKAVRKTGVSKSRPKRKARTKKKAKQAR